MKYGWARLSKDDSKKESIEAQIELFIQNGVSKENIYYDKGKSASIDDEQILFKFDGDRYNISIELNRPRFKELLKKLKTGDELYFTKYDRVSRNIMFQEAFITDCRKKEIILKPLVDIDNPLTRRILSVIAQNEADNISVRGSIISEYLFNKGLHPYRTPYGYRKNTEDKITGKLIYPEQPKGIIIPYEPEAQIVRRIYEYSQNTKMTYQQIAEAMQMHPQQVINILRNDIYQGWIHYKDQKKKGIHQPIIL